MPQNKNTVSSPTFFKIYVQQTHGEWKRGMIWMGIEVNEICLDLTWTLLLFLDDQIILADDIYIKKM